MGRRTSKLSQLADSAPKPLGDGFPAFGRNGMPLVRKARRAEQDFEAVKCAVADQRFFAGTGTRNREQIWQASGLTRHGRVDFPGRLSREIRRCTRMDLSMVCLGVINRPPAGSMTECVIVRSTSSS